MVSGQVLLAYADQPAPQPDAPATAGTAGDAAAPPPAPPQATGAPEGQSGDIVVVGRGPPPKEDPMQAVNLQTYKAVQAVDGAIVAPLAKGYRSVVPEPVRDGLANALDNLDEPVNALNFLLQLKPGKALVALGRFAINSTIGIGGLFDVASKKPFRMPKRINGLSNTLAFYGVGAGPFLIVPTIGPTTARDLIGQIVDNALVPRFFGKPFNKPEFQIPKAVIKGLNYRLASDARITKLRDNSDDGYGEIRKEYLERRQREVDVIKGKRKTAAPDPVPPAQAAAAPAAAPAEVAPPPPPEPVAPPAPPAPVFISQPVIQPVG